MTRNKKIYAYNELEVLITATKLYRERIGHYPERILMDKIYRNRRNLDCCKLHGIPHMGPPLGRLKKDGKLDKRTEFIDNFDRVKWKELLVWLRVATEVEK